MLQGWEVKPAGGFTGDQVAEMPGKVEDGDLSLFSLSEHLTYHGRHSSAEPNFGNLIVVLASK